MNDRAEIINFLKTVWTWAATYSIRDADCPKIAHYVDGAIRLLEAQEARVLTLEEVMNAAGTPAYMEAKSWRSYTGWALIYDVQKGLGITGTRIGMTQPGHVTIWPAAALYGVKWRAWTGRPTEEQRKAIPWDG